MDLVETLAKEARKTPQTSHMQTLLEVYDLDEYGLKDQKDFLDLPAVSAAESFFRGFPRSLLRFI